MTGTTAFRCADAPELRARDSWPQPIANDVRQVWKLGDFDAHRKEAEAVGPYTAHYASPEVAQAKALGAEVLAHPAMDIFSFGLVAVEMLRGKPFISSIEESKEEALRTLGGDGLEEMLREAMEPLPPLLKPLLDKMLKVSPAERTSAADLRNASVLTGNVRRLPSPAMRMHALPCMCHRLLSMIPTAAHKHDPAGGWR